MVFASVTLRPCTSLERVLDDLGTTLLELVCGDPAASAEIGGVVIHDPVDEPELPSGALVLGVGLSDPEQIAGLLRSLGRRGAVGLVLRAPVAADALVRHAAADSGVAVLSLTRGVSWAELAALLRSLFAEYAVGVADADGLGRPLPRAMFTLANAVAALVDAPVTIEDRASRVLAFSGRQDEADRSRVETILGIQVPRRCVDVYTERGVFRELYRSDRPVWIEPLPGPGELPRVAIAVRVNNQVLGSIWAAVDKPLSDERAQALVDAAKQVGIHMLHIRIGDTFERGIRTDLLRIALDGGPSAGEALSRLGLADQSIIVLALGIPEPNRSAKPISVDAGLISERQRITDGFAMHLAATDPRCVAALLGDVTYGLLPSRGNGVDGEDRAYRIATEFLDRVRDRGRAAIGIGPVVNSADGLAYARASADRALRVLGSGSGSGLGRRVARLTDVYVESLLLELRDVVTARGDRPSGAVALLWEYDERHHGQLVETLHAWLNTFGDITAAAAAVHVHPNTFRYRLRRVVEVGGVGGPTRDDPDARLAAMLQLRVIADVANGRSHAAAAGTG